MILEKTVEQKYKEFRNRSNESIKLASKILREQSENGSAIVVHGGRYFYVDSVSVSQDNLKLHVQSIDGSERVETIIRIKPGDTDHEIFCYRWKNGIRKRESRYTICRGTK